VPFTYDGQCPSSSVNSLISSSAVASISTAFGYDTMTGCTVTLTRSQLKDFCCTGASSGTCLANSFSTDISESPYISVSSGLPYFLNFTAGYIGIYGDADPLDLSQWFAMSYTIPQDARTWNDETSTCSNVYANMNLQFLIALSAEKTSPQYKIVAALAEVTTSDWIFS
jgi:hypothetical protein